ncbi:alpha/beta fold hydrolase [Actinomadura rifamycini]|uniref:alpha/beta fold hydrolase n=1 Tax=Actinomadura rifamycini TaxID=31962 RepID=UPI00055597D4|nr:alpha/beta hydrolase [Actinomadura rifamycini]
METENVPVVLLHGIRVSGTMWGPLAERLRERHRVVAPDLPGHGRRRGERFTMDGAVDAVAEAVDGLGGRALVAGLSLGGFVGIAAAARHPGRVAGLVAMGCTTRPEGFGRAVYRTAGRLAGRWPAYADAVGALAFRRALPGPAAGAVLAGGLSSAAFPQAVEAVCGFDPVAALAAYPGPVWLANGTRDPFRSHERAFLRACRDGRLVLWPGRGHLGALHDPALPARLVLDAAALARDADVRA